MPLYPETVPSLLTRGYRAHTTRLEPELFAHMELPYSLTLCVLKALRKHKASAHEADNTSDSSYQTEVESSEIEVDDR